MQRGRSAIVIAHFADTVYPYGMPLVLHAFRYRSPLTGKWVTARYRAEVTVIRERHAEFELLGEPEIREPVLGSFSPYRRPVSGE